MGMSAPRVAISLVNLNSCELLIPAINSLIDSDFGQHAFKLFYWDNGSTDGCVDFVRGLDIDSQVYENSENLGITEPRIRVMDAILAEGCWDLVLEIHSDMLFPSRWFKPLLTQLDERTGILMPFIVQKSEYIFDLALLEQLVERYSSDRLIHNSIAVHPWLINLAAVRDIGYYDAAYQKHRGEDDDFMFRMLFSRWDIKAWGGSVVFHKGEIVRKQYLKRNDNEKIFKAIEGFLALRDNLRILEG